MSNIQHSSIVEWEEDYADAEELLRRHGHDGFVEKGATMTCIVDALSHHLLSKDLAYRDARRVIALLQTELTRLRATYDADRAEKETAVG